MGVSDFLRIALDSAGTKVDLREFRGGIDVTLPFSRKRKRRKLRIGVDVSHWIYKACHRFGPMLAEERHHTNYGRYQLVRDARQSSEEPSNNDTVVNPETEQKYITSCCLFVIQKLRSLRNETNADVLAVLDGATPPIKAKVVQKRSATRKEHVRVRDAPIDVAAASRVTTDGNEFEELNEERFKANRRAGAGPLYGAIIEDLLGAMRSNEIPFMVAPYEADGQLAHLSKEKFIDLVVTNDSDLMAQGAVCVIYKMDISVPNPSPSKRKKENNDERDRGNDSDHSLSHEDTNEGSFPPRGVLLQQDELGSVTIPNKSTNNTNLSLADMSDAVLAVLFVAAGSDYCDKLKGIGLITACNIVRQSFFPSRTRFHSSQSSELSSPPLAKCFDLLFQSTYDRSLQGDRARQEQYKSNFLAALLMYRHPVVYDPFTRTFLVSYEDYGDPELLSYQPYRELLQDKARRAQIIGDLDNLDSAKATLIAEGWISPRTLDIYAVARTGNIGIPQALQALLASGNASENETENHPVFDARSKNDCPALSETRNRSASASGNEAGRSQGKDQETNTSPFSDERYCDVEAHNKQSMQEEERLQSPVCDKMNEFHSPLLDRNAHDEGQSLTSVGQRSDTQIEDAYMRLETQDPTTLTARSSRNQGKDEGAIADVRQESEPNSITWAAKAFVSAASAARHSLAAVAATFGGPSSGAKKKSAIEQRAHSGTDDEEEPAIGEGEDQGSRHDVALGSDDDKERVEDGMLVIHEDIQFEKDDGKGKHMTEQEAQNEPEGGEDSTTLVETQPAASNRASLFREMVGSAEFDLEESGDSQVQVHTDYTGSTAQTQSEVIDLMSDSDGDAEYVL